MDSGKANILNNYKTCFTLDKTTNGEVQPAFCHQMRRGCQVQFFPFFSSCSQFSTSNSLKQLFCHRRQMHMYYILFKHRLMAGINAIYVFLFIAVIYLLQTL